MPKFHLLPLQNQRCRVLSREEEILILAESKPHLRDLIIILVDTGARLSEALDLMWDNVDLDSNNKASITLLKTKNGLPRRIPLTSRATNLLLAIRKARKNLNLPVFLYHEPVSIQGHRPGQHIVGKVRCVANDGSSMRKATGINPCNYYRGLLLPRLRFWINLRHGHSPLSFGHVPIRVRFGVVFLGLLGGLEFFEYLLSQPVIFLLGNELLLKQVVQLFKTVGNR
jgi:hypothetical protein